MLNNTEIPALSSTLNVLFFYLLLFGNEVYFLTTMNVWMCTSAWHLLSLSKDVAAGRRLWQSLLGWDIWGPYSRLCPAVLDALQTIVKLVNNCQYEQILTLTLWGCSALVKQWSMTAHTYFISSHMQIMETWQKINFLGCQCRFMKASYDMAVYHVFRR